nr:hypothetical protein [Tanacetum cinerariifolium]
MPSVPLKFKVLATRRAYHPSLVSCLPSLGESLPSMPNAYAVSGVSGAETYVYTPAPGESEAHNGLPDSILSYEPKPLMQHRPPLLQSVWCSPAKGGDSEVSGDGDGVGVARSLSTSASGGKDMAA